MRMRVLALTGLAWFALGCADRAPSPEPLALGSAQSAMDSIWGAYSRAAVAGDADAIARFYADTAHLAEPGMPTIRTSADLRAVAVEAFKAGKYLSAEMRPEITEVAGDRIIQAGTYSDVFQPTGDVAKRGFGRFMVVARREPDGKVRISHLVAALDSTVAVPSPQK